MNRLFVSGTDTDVGKTCVSQILCYAFSQITNVTYFKPVQSGAPRDTDSLRNLLGGRVSYKSPVYEFDLPASPNRAAAAENREIHIDRILQEPLPESFVVLEGAGGLLVPLNRNNQIIDLPKKAEWPVVLVASTSLGTINHTLLSVEALKNRGVACVGIVLNGDEDKGLKELLEEQTGLPVLFEVPRFHDLSIESLQEFYQTSEDLRAFTDAFLSQTSSAYFCKNGLEAIEVPNASDVQTKEHAPLRTCDFRNDTTAGFSEERKEEIIKKDKNFVWHPFTQHGIVKNHPLVIRGQGIHLQTSKGNIIDAISSWWVNLFGHSHPRLVRAVHSQAKKLEHVIFAGFTHEPAIELSETLIRETKKTGAHLGKVFFSDNGSTSVEVALKMAFQYHKQTGKAGKTRFLAFKGSYHGDTLGAMSVGERKGFNEVFTPLMFDVDFIDPFETGALKQAFEKRGDQYAAVIVEPMVQGASGMRMYPQSLLDELECLKKQYETFVICDEVFTGFYRTGKMFAFEHSNLKPDFLCLSKGLTGGFLPLAVTLARDEFFESFQSSDMRQAFLHGHSYTANPIACQVACETLRMLTEKTWQQKIQEISQWTEEALGPIESHPRVHNIRHLGTIGAFEVNDQDPHYFKGDFSYRINQAALEKGVLLRPLGGTLYTVPPYCIEKQEFDQIYQVIHHILEKEI